MTSDSTHNTMAGEVEALIESIMDAPVTGVALTQTAAIATTAASVSAPHDAYIRGFPLCQAAYFQDPRFSFTQSPYDLTHSIPSPNSMSMWFMTDNVMSTYINCLFGEVVKKTERYTTLKVNAYRYEQVYLDYPMYYHVSGTMRVYKNGTYVLLDEKSWTSSWSTDDTSKPLVKRMQNQPKKNVISMLLSPFNFHGWIEQERVAVPAVAFTPKSSVTGKGKGKGKGNSAKRLRMN